MCVCVCVGHAPQLVRLVPLCVSVSVCMYVCVCVGHVPRLVRLVPQPDIEPVPPIAEVQSTHHWMTREFLGII